MPKIIRYEFIASPIVFWLLCVTVIFLPLAISTVSFVYSDVSRFADEPSMDISSMEGEGYGTTIRGSQTADARRMSGNA
jgi:hypothetical protein